MGFQDRDYYRPPPESRFAMATGSTVKVLVVINFVCFFTQLLTSAGGDGPSWFTQLFAMNPEKVFHEGQVWRLLTAAFLHDTHGAWHIIFNMLALWYFGTDIEELYGRKEFLAFYLLAAVLSSLAFGATYSFAHRGEGPGGWMVGASGAVFAVSVLCACHYPYRTILLFFIIPLPLWLVVGLYVFSDFVVFMNGKSSGVAVAAHLGGAAFGFLYYKMNWRILSLFDGIADYFARRKIRRSNLRLYRPPTDERPKLGVYRPEPVDEQLEAKVDAILSKLSVVGREHLTEEERQILEKASELFRKRRT